MNQQQPNSQCYLCFTGRFELPDGVQRESFLEIEQVTWVTLQPREGVFLKALPHQPEGSPCHVTQGTLEEVSPPPH